MTINAKLKKTGDLFEIHNERDSLSGVAELEKRKLYSGTLYIGQFLRDKAPDGYTVFVYTERQQNKEFHEEELEIVKAVNLRFHRAPPTATEPMQGITVTSFCHICNGQVSAPVMVPPDELKTVIDTNVDIKVMHMAPEGGDHVWRLTDDEKANLKGLFAEGLL